MLNGWDIADRFKQSTIIQPVHTIERLYFHLLKASPPEVRKNRLVISLVTKKMACYHGFKVYFTTMATLMRNLKETQSKHKAFPISSLVVVDEIGYLPVDIKEAPSSLNKCFIVPHKKQISVI